jgi:long-chain acyl-CoA synthetase
VKKELVYARLFLPSVDRHADRVALHDGGYTATFGEHAERVLRLADALRAGLGLGPDDRFAVVSLNSHCYLELYHAAYLGAATIVPVNYRLADPEIAHVLRHSGVKVVFVDAFSEARVRALLGDGPGPRLVNLSDEYEQLMASGEQASPPEAEEWGTPMVMYTGGTTGRPKGVVTSQRAQVLNLYHLAQVQGLAFSEQAVYLHHMPMFHATGLNAGLSAAAYGTEAAVVPGFDPGLFLDAVEKHQVTETVLVPTMIAMVLQHPSYQPGRLSSLRRIGYGGMAMPHALLAALQQSTPDVQLLQGYGMTEACAGVTFLTAADHLKGEEHRHSVGRALPGIEVGTFSDDGTRLAPGEVGEVCVRAGNLMEGYLDDPEATARVFREDWYRTGDLGRLSADGYLTLVDRVDDMIVTGGENVYSVEVENAISTFPGVLQVAVVGVSDETWGKRVHALVVLTAEAYAATTEEALSAHARTIIAGYKVPKSWELRTDPLPVSAAGKPLKRELRT